MIKSRRNFMSAMLSIGLVLPNMDLFPSLNIYENLKVLGRWTETREILGAFPAKSPDISTRKSGEHTIFTDVNVKRDVLRSNNMAAAIWDYCTGENGVDDMVDKITSDFDVERDICMRDVVLTLGTFKRKGLVVL